jgi:inosine triphosphate pyrophosphatase
MVLYFVSGNEHKLEEFNQILSPELRVYQMDLDLAEIQSTDAQDVIKHKLVEAMKYQTGELLVEDTSLYLEVFDWKLPGPLIKWFIKSIGCLGIYNLTQKLGLVGAEARTCIGYSNGREIIFFEGSVKGKIIKPKVKSNFGWDPIFCPDGFKKPFGEMTKHEKNSISMRKKALDKFKEYYLKNNKKVENDE